MLNKLTPEFSFAGFTFPRYIADLPDLRPTGARWQGMMTTPANEVQALNLHILWKRREARKVCGPMYCAPRPNGPACCGFYLDSSGQPGLRMEEIGAKAWRNSDSDDEYIPLVARLPKSRGFLAGWTMGTHSLSELEGEIYDTREDALRRAIDAAESAANDNAPEPIEDDAPQFDETDAAIIRLKLSALIDAAEDVGTTNTPAAQGTLAHSRAELLAFLGVPLDSDECMAIGGVRELLAQASRVLVQAVEAAGFNVSGPSDVRAAEHGEPAWVCNARECIAAIGA